MRKGFTLVEVLGVMALAGILCIGLAVSGNRIWQNNRIDICESELREMTTAFKSYLTDYGSPVIEPDVNYEPVLEEIIEILNQKYLPYTIEKQETAADKTSVHLKTSVKKDPWGNPYDLYIYTAENAENVPGLVIMISSGKNGQCSRATYASGNFGDDVIALVEPD